MAVGIDGDTFELTQADDYVVATNVLARNPPVRAALDGEFDVVLSAIANLYPGDQYHGPYPSLMVLLQGHAPSRAHRSPQPR